MGSSGPRDKTHISMSPALTGGFFTTSANWKAHHYAGIKNLFFWGGEYFQTHYSDNCPALICDTISIVVLKDVETTK